MPHGKNNLIHPLQRQFVLLSEEMNEDWKSSLLFPDRNKMYDAGFGILFCADSVTWINFRGRNQRFNSTDHPQLLQNSDALIDGRSVT